MLFVARGSGARFTGVNAPLHFAEGFTDDAEPQVMQSLKGLILRLLDELRITPEVISVLDYSKGFDHSDLVTFSDRDLDIHLSSNRHFWNGSAT